MSSFEQQQPATAEPLLTSAESRFDAISGSMFKLGALFCCESGCATPMDPCLLTSSKFFCCKGDGHSGGEKGLSCSVVAKTLCIVQGVTMPFNCTACNKDLAGSPPREANETEDAWMPGVFWCIFCGCVGLGFTSCEPCVHWDVQMCCAEGQARTVEACPASGGCVQMRSKICCIVAAQECPPTMDIGFALCGFKLVGGKPEEARDVTVAPAQNEMK